jgi:hypothetical protein
MTITITTGAIGARGEHSPPPSKMVRLILI